MLATALSVLHYFITSIFIFATVLTVYGANGWAGAKLGFYKKKHLIILYPVSMGGQIVLLDRLSIRQLEF